jgi:hypothetical protein
MVRTFKSKINEKQRLEVENIKKGIDHKIIINQNEVNNVFDDIFKETCTKNDIKIN